MAKPWTHLVIIRTYEHCRLTRHRIELCRLTPTLFVTPEGRFRRDTGIQRGRHGHGVALPLTLVSLETIKGRQLVTEQPG